MAADGTVYVSYASGQAGSTPNQLRLATRSTQGVWGSDFVDTGGLTDSGIGSDIAVDSLGGVHIVHSGTGGLHDTVRSAGSTELLAADAANDTGAIAVDGFGDVHVIFRQTGSGSVQYLRRPAGGSWLSAESVETQTTTGRMELAADVDGHVHVVYLQSGALIYARKTRCP